MASQVAPVLSQLAKLQKGFIQVSMTHWTDTAEPELAAGSGFEVGGVPFYCDGNDDLDVAGAWGGIANSTLVFIYYAVSGTTATAELSTTAPTWDTAKQGWYDAGATKRCIGSIFKDASGNYSQKTIFLNREDGITYQGMISPLSTVLTKIDAGIVNSYKAAAGAADVLLKSLVNPGPSVVEGTAFNIKKPVSAFLTATGNNSFTQSSIQVQSSTGWVNVSGLDNTYAGHSQAGILVPGTYRIRSQYTGTTSLYALGVYGDTAITAADIVT